MADSERDVLAERLWDAIRNVDDPRIPLTGASWKYLTERERESVRKFAAALAARGWRLVPSAETSSAYLLGYDAALAAQPSAEPGLEVREALKRLWTATPHRARTGSGGWSDGYRAALDDVAALTPDRPTPGDE